MICRSELWRTQFFHIFSICRESKQANCCLELATTGLQRASDMFMLFGSETVIMLFCNNRNRGKLISHAFLTTVISKSLCHSLCQIENCLPTLFYKGDFRWLTILQYCFCKSIPYLYHDRFIFRKHTEINPLWAKFFSGNICIYLHFMSFFQIPQVTQGPTCFT